MSLSSRFDRREILGKGAFGEVYAAVRVCDKKRFALKVVRISNNRHDLEMATKEATIHAKLSHCNILHFVEAITLFNEIHMVVEFCGEGTMLDILATSRADDHLLRLSFVAQICAGVHYLHEGWSSSKSIIHRDIKLENVLITSDFRAKISDFGLALEKPKGIQGVWGKAGTPGYMSPEMSNGLQYCEKTDLWSLGCVVYEILTQQFWSVESGDPGADFLNIAQKLSELAMPERSIARSLLNKNPRLRASAGSLLAHPLVMEHLQNVTTFARSKQIQTSQVNLILNCGLVLAQEEVDKVGEESFATAGDHLSHAPLLFELLDSNSRCSYMTVLA